MCSWDMAKETKETIDMVLDIQEINAVLNAPWFDEQKAQEIIMKHNSKDPLVYAHNNNPATTILLNNASTEILYRNLQAIREYLIAKRTAELAKKAAERDMNNADLQAMLLIYGVEVLDTENPNIPPCFMAVGENDNNNYAVRSANLFLQLNERGVSSELHIIADCEHGFGLADGHTGPLQKMGSINGAKEWPELAVTFLDVKPGYLPRINEVGK